MSSMKMYNLIFVFLSLFSSLLAKEVISAQDEYNAASVAFQKKKWTAVKEHSKKVIDFASDSPFIGDLYFYMGAAHFHQKDFDKANYYFSKFLKDHNSPKYFEEALIYKFEIAEQFQKGAKKHLFGAEKMPKLTSAWEDAYFLYDEVITTLPRHEVAAKALFNKATMMRVEEKFAESIEIFQTLIRRFPKNPLAPKSYIAIAEAYCAESKNVFPDRDFLDQARLNVKKFKRDFPSDERVVQVDKMLSSMQDNYAEDLWDSANYFARKKKMQSCILYYTSIVRKFPESKFAPKALKKISELKVQYPKEVQNVTFEDKTTA